MGEIPALCLWRLNKFGKMAAKQDTISTFASNRPLDIFHKTSRDSFQPCLWRQNEVGVQLPDERPLLKKCQCVNNFKRETTGYAALFVVTEPGGRDG